MRHTVFVVAILLLISCAPQKGTVVVTATTPPLNVIGTSTPLPTDTATPLPRPTSAPKETGTPQDARADPKCLYGPGQWIGSALNDAELSGNLALELMYGPDSNAVCTNVQRHWSDSDGIEDYPYFAHLFTIESMRFEDRVVLVASVAPRSEAGRFVAITGRTCEHCFSHASGAQLIGAIFAREGNRWQMIVPTHFITEFGSWGEFHDSPENKQLARIGPDKYGIILKDTTSYQGVAVTTMIIISELNGQLRTILDPEITSEDGSGFCDPDIFPKCFHYDSQVDFIRGGNPHYFDLRITTQGTDSDSDHWGQLKDASRIRLFQFKNGKYVSSDSRDQLASRSD